MTIAQFIPAELVYSTIKVNWEAPGYSAAEDSANYSTLRKVLEEPMKRWLLDRKAKGVFNSVDTKGHDALILRVWNGFMLGKPGSKTESDAVAYLANEWALTFSVCFSKKSKRSFEECYKEACSDFDENRMFLYLTDSSNCTKTGYRVFLGYAEGKVVARAVVNLEVTDLPGVSDAQVSTFSIDVASGTLLVADWIRINPFTERTLRAVTAELDNAQGRVEHARELADYHVAFVSTTLMPMVLQKNNSLVAVDACEPADVAPLTKTGWKILGRVDSALWAVTMVDRAVIAHYCEAELVDAYCQEHDVIQVNVEPGRYAWHMSGEVETFNAAYTRYNLPALGRGVSYVALLERVAD